MSTHVIKVLAPRVVAAPRGARWAATAVVWIARVLSTIGSKAVKS